MKINKWSTLLLFLLPVSLGACSTLNHFQREGEISLQSLEDKVTVQRDEKGMAYIYARNMDDAFFAQGFVTAQDRLFQMELTRLFSSGRLSELAGAEAKALDIRMRTIGFFRNAQRHVSLLDASTRKNLQRYVDGINTYLKESPDTLPLEFKLSGITPQPWRLEDVLAIMYTVSWDTSANLKTEIIAQMLIEKLGIEKAREIFPLTINPDDQKKARQAGWEGRGEVTGLNLGLDQGLLGFLEPGALQIGSNNWVMGSRSSAGGKPILANDPHLDARILPGPWYPCGLITPEMRFVGVGIPGTPGLIVGRSEHLAVGITNSYGDTQDLYIETIDPKDPDRYLEGEQSVPFQIIEETLKIKDKQAPEGFRREKVRIRLTRRGPLVSGVLPGLRTDKVMTLRWAPFETMGPSLGLDKVQTARSVEEVRAALKEVNWISLNFVFADTRGDLGWQVSGKLPIRSQREGTVPFVVRDSRDNWIGWIPFEQMPQAINPARGWLGTTNHRTITEDYPYYYSSHLSPSYRQRRLSALLDTPGLKSVEDHWRFQRDSLNLMAKEIAPVMIRALRAHEDTKAMAEILSRWNFHDAPDSPAPTIFQATYGRFARLFFEPKLGADLTGLMLDNWYFWQERLQAMILEETSTWFEQTEPGRVRETVETLFRQAALAVIKEFSPPLGQDPEAWLWGKVHQLELVSPIRRTGVGKGLLGGGSHPMGGSGETLYRSVYGFNQPFGVTVSASLRMVADLADHDKILAVLPGGVTARLFDPHTTDQIEAFMKGEKRYWWFSDQAIKEHTRHTLILNPR
ncbi:MAG: penicillin acylase family protein [Desulfobacca sp.]|nr:penicillin acylase family protein [Desulfobacca sp.]